MIAMTPQPPYYAVIFITTLEERTEGYADMSKLMVELSSQQEGFLGIESVRKDLGITICYWRDEKSIRGWYENDLHRIAQQKGRSEWFKSLRIRVARVEREYGFDK